MTTLLRGHGLGNDYLVLEAGTALTPDRVVQICDRHTGVGSDGILEPGDPGRADYGVRIWNPDGSVAEKSGNGLRIYAAWLHAHRSAPADFTVWTGHDTVRCQIQPTGVRVEMGRARVDPLQVELNGSTVRGVRVDVGNPHFVVFVDDFSLDWRSLGRALEVHPAFPQRTNVQFACIVDGQPHARIWERGAGETQASGSSSCAVAAASVFTGRVPAGPIDVQMPGGSLRVEITGGEGRYDVVLTGPAVLVCRIELLDGWLLG